MKNNLPIVWSMDIFWSNAIQVLFQLVYHEEYENLSVNLNKTLTSTGKFRPFKEFLYLLNMLKKNGTYTALYSSCKYESVKKISCINYEDIYTTRTLL